MLLLIDNYDSFVHNLARYFVELGCEARVVRNDAVTVAEVREMAPSAIVISPGPRTPRESGVSVSLIREFGPSIPMLGVCLGHQAIAAAFGGQVIRADEPVHGRTSWVRHDERRLFVGLPNPLRATRYHSLIVDEVTLPSDLIVTARTENGVPMALEHERWPLFGVQFHPESVLSQRGRSLLSNFLTLAGLSVRPCWVEDWIEPVGPIDDECVSHCRSPGDVSIALHPTHLVPPQTNPPHLVGKVGRTGLGGWSFWSLRASLTRNAADSAR